jgi:hypothetical protein
MTPNGPSGSGATRLLVDLADDVALLLLVDERRGPCRRLISRCRPFHDLALLRLWQLREVGGGADLQIDRSFAASTSGAASRLTCMAASTERADTFTARAAASVALPSPIAPRKFALSDFRSPPASRWRSLAWASYIGTSCGADVRAVGLVQVAALDVLRHDELDRVVAVRGLGAEVAEQGLDAEVDARLQPVATVQDQSSPRRTMRCRWPFARMSSRKAVRSAYPS